MGGDSFLYDLDDDLSKVVAEEYIRLYEKDKNLRG